MRDVDELIMWWDTDLDDEILDFGLWWEATIRNFRRGTSLVVQCVRLHNPNAGGPGSIPGRGTRSHMHAATKSSHARTKDPACCNEDPVCRN